MGVGEPLDNMENLLRAINIVSDKDGIALGKRKITVSTCGLPDKIIEFAKEKTGVNFSVSLHSAIDSKRSKIMPVNRKHPLAELKKSIIKYQKIEKIPVTFEYILISKFNTFHEDAAALSGFIRGINSKINLIPFNPSRFFKWQPPEEAEVREFTSVLDKKKVFYTLRKPVIV